jgi:hypothetical protein
MDVGGWKSMDGSQWIDVDGRKSMDGHSWIEVDGWKYVDRWKSLMDGVAKCP